MTHLDLHPQPTCRFLQFSDWHSKGDAEYAADVVRTINTLEPEFVCFTGDLAISAGCSIR